jgi:serine protease Do
MEIYMKKQGKSIASLLLLLVMLATSVGFLSGCDLLSAAPTVSIVGTEINADGELIIRYSNGLRDNLGVVVGKDGTVGAATVTSAEINANGELVLHYSDSTTQNLGVIGGQNVDVNIEITGEAEGVAAAVSAAAPSVVSVFCSFTNVTPVGVSVSKGTGSGVIYSLDKETGDALIITNYHVVYESGKIADKITVNVFGSPLTSQAITATFVGGSMQEDIAVLRVQGSEFLKNSVAKAATLASVDSIYAGDTAIAIGNPSGKGISATYGKVNVVTERMETTASDGVTEVTRRVMRIDTAVNKGNSGGGLFDSEGRLIGIISAKIIEENIENIGFAFPVDKVQALVDNIVYYCLDGEYVTPYKPTLGVKMQVVDSAAVLNQSTGLFETVETVAISAVAAAGAADGLCEVGDRLLSIRVGDYTVKVTRLHHLTEASWRLRPGETFYLKVLRDGEEIDLEIIPENSAYNPC